MLTPDPPRRHRRLPYNIFKKREKRISITFAWVAWCEMSVRRPEMPRQQCPVRTATPDEQLATGTLVSARWAHYLFFLRCVCKDVFLWCSWLEETVAHPLWPGSLEKQIIRLGCHFPQSPDHCPMQDSRLSQVSTMDKYQLCTSTVGK